MSRYVLTQEQLDRLQGQIQQLTRLNDSKQERIRELELHKIRVNNTETAELLKIIGNLENEINSLVKTNERLKSELKTRGTSVARIKELEMLLEEEQKLRKYSEAFAKQVELKCAEESLIKDLTTELCQLQKAEIEIDNKRIQEMQKQLKKLTEEEPSQRGTQTRGVQDSIDTKSTKKIQETQRRLETLTEEPRVVNAEKEKKQIANTWSMENAVRNRQMKVITEQLKSQLFDLYHDIEKNPAKTREEEVRIKELEKWLKEAGILMADINNIDTLNKDLKYMRNEIENRRKSILKYDT